MYRTPAAVAAIAATLVLLGGCGSGTASTGSTPPATVTDTATAPASSPPPPVTTSASPTPTPTAPAEAPGCKTANVQVSLGPTEGAAGSTYVPLRFTNHGSASCLFFGYPGVSFVGANGAQLGNPATQDRTKGAVHVTLQPGAVATATVRVGQAQNYDPATSKPVRARGFRVYPPGNTAATFVASSAFTACASTKVTILTTTALAAG